MECIQLVKFWILMTEGNDSEVIEFIDKYITCSLPDAAEHPELNGLIKKVQTHHHTTTCWKEKGVKCRFNAPWPPSEKTLIVRGQREIKINAFKLKQSKKILGKVLESVGQIDDISNITQAELLNISGVSKKTYRNALQYVQKSVSIIYKRRPCEVYVGPYNTVFMMILKSNMNIQFVTGVYAMLTYLI